ncbi:MAG: hypothetical protein JNM17_00190 [Archangium sp.]|nr:hypothetical protein [Archangium sp.]
MVVPRLATPADNSQCLQLFSTVPMRGELVLSTQREPDFFQLYAMQKAEPFTWVGDDGTPQLVGMCSALIRDGWLDGAPARVGYLGDLRVRFDRARTFGKFFGEFFDQLCAETKCSAYYTAILSSNRAAMNALTKRRPKRPNQPWYSLLHEFDAVSVQLTRKRTPSADVKVRSARAEDVPRIAEVLAESHARRAFGYRFDQGEFEHRVKHWPGFSLDETLIAEDAGGALMGVTTVWDPSSVKRYRVHAYEGSMKWVKRGFNLAARVAGWPRLPEPGNEFRYAYLSNLWVRDESPRVFRALLEHAYARLQPRGFHFFTFELDAGDALAPALSGFMVRKLGFSLFGVTPASVARTQWQRGRTGFEIALA